MQPCYLIAEMACSHEGNPEIAKKLIAAAGAAGANAIQFQIWHLPTYMSPLHPHYPKLKTLELAASDWSNLARFAREQFPALEIIACVSEPVGVDIAVKFGADAFKVHAGDIANIPLLHLLARQRKRIDLSVGACSFSEVETAVHILRKKTDLPIWLLGGHQSFPTPPAELSLRKYRALGQHFALPWGYQDHSDPESALSFALPALALGLGATILEKHLTHDRALKGCDHEAALNPNEFSLFAQHLRQLESALAGSNEDGSFSEAELSYRRYARKSLASRRPLQPGETLTSDDLILLRTSPAGLEWEAKDQVLGRVAQTHIPSLAPLQGKDFHP